MPDTATLTDAPLDGPANPSEPAWFSDHQITRSPDHPIFELAHSIPDSFHQAFDDARNQFLEAKRLYLEAQRRYGRFRRLAYLYRSRLLRDQELASRNYPHRQTADHF